MSCRHSVLAPARRVTRPIAIRFQLNVLTCSFVLYHHQERLPLKALSGRIHHSTRGDCAMTDMGAYCKAYQLKQLRQFEQWPRSLAATRQEPQNDDRETQRPLNDEDVLYLQETYIVTDGLFLDQNVVFDAVTDAWKDFCDRVLDFKIPEYAQPVGETGDRE
ncbi:MAG: hypothetical protein AAF704_14960 [Cyanobacteria bacterium P01_D01_bin.123]